MKKGLYMKKLLAIMTTAAIILSVTACGGQTETTTPETTAETTAAETTETTEETTSETAETTEATEASEATETTEAAETTLVDYIAPQYDLTEARSELSIDFLDDEQFMQFYRANQIASMFNMAASISNLEEYTISETDDYKKITNVSYESFLTYINSVFTYEKTVAYLDSADSPFTNVDGAVCWVDGARGGNITFKDISFELISQTDDNIKFKGIATYQDDEESDPYTEEYEYEMVKQENGWNLTDFTMWY